MWGRFRGFLGTGSLLFWSAVHIYILRQLFTDGCLFLIRKNIPEGSIETDGDLSNMDSTKMKGGMPLTFKQLLEKYPNKVCVVVPKKRSKRNGRVIRWKVINTFYDVDSARKAISFYESELLAAVPISTCEDFSAFPSLKLPPDLAAKFFRCYYNPCYSG